MTVVSDDLFVFYERLVGAGVICMITGSVGSSAYGEPRGTLDIDLVVALRPADIERVIAAFPEPRFYLPSHAIIARESARSSGHFNIIEVDTGLKADLYPIGDDPLLEYGLDNATEIELAGRRVVVAPPTYLVAMKLRYFAMSQQDKHLRDIRGIVRLSGHLLDRTMIAHWAAKAGVGDAWRDCQERAGQE